MKSHFLNLLNANTTLFSVENKEEVAPFMPLDLPSTEGSVPAKSTGAVPQGKQVTHHLLTNPTPASWYWESEKPADKNFMGPQTDKEFSKTGKK